MNDLEAKPEGFGGWLLLVAVGQWLGIFGMVGQFLWNLPNYLQQWSDPAAHSTMLGEVAIDMGLLAFMLYTTISMSLKQRVFPTLFRIQIALLVVVPLLSTWWMTASTGTKLDGLSFAGTTGQAIFGTIGATFSILYSLRSERVRNTFVF